MSKFKWPNLHKGLTKRQDGFFLSDYIYIKNYHALVFNNDYIVACDLETLFGFKKDLTFEIDPHLENILDVVKWLEGKYLTADFWSELATGEEITVSDDQEVLIITSQGTMKELHYVDPPAVYTPDLNEAIDKIVKISKKQTLGQAVANIEFNTVLKLNAMFGTLIKDDALILELFGKEQPIRFTFHANRHVFGVIVSSYDINAEMFISLSMEEFVKELLKPVE